MSSDTTELMLALLLSILALHTILGAGFSTVAASIGRDLWDRSHWADPTTVLTVITATVSFAVLAVRLVWLIIDSGAYDDNNDHHISTTLGLVAVPVVVGTAFVSRLVATRPHADANDFVNRHLTAWAVGILAVAVVAGPLFVVLSFFPFKW